MMNRTEKNIPLFLNVIIFIVCYAVLISYSLGPQSSLDTYWHLQIGQDLLEKGLSPWVDHYSFTFSGKEINPVPFLFQVTLATLVSIFGETSGLILLKVIYVTLLLFVVYRFFRQIKAPWFIIFLILPILVYFINMRLIVRPDTLSNILIIICLSLYLKARESFSTKELASICLLLLFWVNYHSSILGYIIIFGLFMDRAIHKLMTDSTPYTWTQWSLWGAFIFIIGFITPDSDHILIQVLSFPDGWHQYLSEYSPSYIVYSSNKMAYLSWIISVYTAFWAMLKKHYGLAFITVLLTYYAWNISRLVPAASLIDFSILAFFLSQLDFNRLFTNIKPMLRVTLVLSSSLLFLFTLSQTLPGTLDRLRSLSHYSQHKQQMRLILDEKFPSQIVDYLNSFQEGGNVLNTFNVGGYLIHTLSPDFKGYIDGRTNILYPIQFYEHYLKVIDDIDTLEDDIKKYHVRYAIFENTPRAHRYFSKTDMLTLNFSNKNYVLFSSDNSTSFPIASKLISFPMCWDDRLSKKIRDEITLADSLFSGKQYTIKSILKLLDGYLSHKKGYQFLDALQPGSLSNDNTKRLAAHLALRVNNFNMANVFFRSITKKNQDDLLMMAYALTKSGNYPSSKAILALYLENKGDIEKDTLSRFDEIIVLKILTAIKKKSKSKGLSSFDIRQIKGKLNLDNEQYVQSLIPGLPYNDICEPIFRSY